MLKKLKLERFKNFREAELNLGNLTLLVGTNASGKSNIRDAFRFLHGISRGYSLPDIIGEKWIEGGVLQWRGIRGGTKEIAFKGETTFALEVSLFIEEEGVEKEAIYRIEVDAGITGKAPRVIAEKLLVAGKYIFDFYRENNQPILSLLSNIYDVENDFKQIANLVISDLNSMRFLDLSPEAMRLPSLPGQTVLGDRGENLSSVLQEICESPEQKQVLLEWIQELTPMDVKDLEFPSDFTGKILLTLIESNGEKISAYSASDGTLRFLAMSAVLLGPNPAKFYFFEELENGIHPSRLHLLIQLIEQQVSRRNICLVATTHSPQLLRLLSKKNLEFASLTYRLPERVDGGIKRIMDIPDARRVIEEQDLARLHEAGWLEDVIYFGSCQT
ncbi:MAG: ATP-binding protein [Cyanobacteriota bacterium]|nr:ATP-binding protein [Cyanobacteriota bacterium]